VLEGIFSDEHADYPAGSYVRNPIGTAHTPHIGPEGATILVKLCQFDPDDTDQKAIDTRGASFEDGPAPGVEVLRLHGHGAETVRLLRFAPGAQLTSQAFGGEEVYVIDGILQDEAGRYPAGTWLRNPPRSAHARRSDEGCLVWVKTGHLPPAEAQAAE
jgi:anti-sigma factor ChrR (cupin superfamily)